MLKIKNIFTWTVVLFSTLLLPQPLFAQTDTKLILHLDKTTVNVSQRLYGLMTEEINYAYDGGLYGELVRNRIFKDNPKTPDHWSLIKAEGDTSSIHLDTKHPINDALAVSLRVNIAQDDKMVGLTNDGFWGIPVKPSTTYHGSFYAMAENNKDAGMVVSIEANGGNNAVFAKADVNGVTNKWRRFTFTLTTTSTLQMTADARLVYGTRVKGLPASEVGRRAGMPPGAVYYALARAERALLLRAA